MYLLSILYHNKTGLNGPVGAKKPLSKHTPNSINIHNY